MYFTSVRNRQVIANPSNAQLKDKMVCSVIYTTKCPSIEYLRFQIMMLWVQEFPRLKFTGYTLKGFIDNVTKTARKYQPKVYFGNVYATTYEEFVNFLPFKTSWSSYGNNRTEWKLIGLNSSQLRIDLEISVDANGFSLFKWVNFTFYLDKESTSLTFNTFEIPKLGFLYFSNFYLIYNKFKFYVFF